MNGRAFIDSAKGLAESGTPTDTRSAISRAYYAAFHAARDFFWQCEIRFSEHSPEAHTKIPQCLDNSKAQVAIDLGGLLRSLREERNGADYRMTDLRFEDQDIAALRIAIAEQILAGIDSMLREPDYSNIRRLLRPKARSLGLNVVGSD